MSNISNVHSVVAFDSKTSRAFENQRLAKVTYKSRGDKKPEFPSVCVSVPVISDVSENEFIALKPHIIEFLAGVQDRIIRARYEETKGTLAQITDAEISVSACVDFLDEESKGGRLTKEFVGEWFDHTLSDSLAVAFADKLGISDDPTEAETKKLEAILGQVRDKFASLSGGKTSYDAKTAGKLAEFLEFAPADDVLAEKFKARLAKMATEQNAWLDAL